MMLFTTIAFSIMAFASFCGVIAEKDMHARKCATICFAICTTLVLIVNILGGVL